MKNRSNLTLKCAIAGALLATTSVAHALVITTSTDAGALTSTLAGTGISVVGGSESHIGTSTQGGTYSDFSLSNLSNTISISDGIVLTSGDATGIDLSGVTNTDSSFDGSLGTAGDADANAVLLAAGSPSSSTNDANVLEFQFTVDSGMTSVSADFIFGSDEYPNQGVTDIFAFFVDDINYAFFPDGSLVNFLLGSPAATTYLNDNDVGNSDQYSDGAGDGFQYDGVTDLLSIVGLLDLTLATHTLKVVVADTSDTVFDSGAFISNLTAGTETGGGINPNPVPSPAPLMLLLAGAISLLTSARKRINSKS